MGVCGLKRKIVDIGKTKRRIESEVVAEALGAEEVKPIKVVVKAYFDKYDKFQKVTSKSDATLEEQLHAVEHYLPTQIVYTNCSRKANRQVQRVEIKSDGIHTIIRSDVDYGRMVGILLECGNKLKHELKNRK